MEQAAELEQAPKQETFSFDDMRLQVGARLQIQVPFRPNAPQYFSTLIGFAKDDYLILKIPFENGLSVKLEPDSTVAVRVLSGVHVFAFSVIVRRVFMAPLFYAHVSFPDKITGTVVRKASRAQVDVPVSVTGDAVNDAVDARFTNLSASGGFIESPTALGDKDQRLRLAFSVRVQPGDREVKMEAEATIRNLRPPAKPGEGTFGYGVRFEDLGEDKTVMLQNVVYQALTENRGI